jgi:hypothetical protein
LHAVTAPTRSRVGQGLVQTGCASTHCRRGRLPVSPYLGARQSARARPCLSYAGVGHSCRSVPTPRPRPLQTEVMRAAWLFRGRKPELHSFSVPPASQERLSSVRLRVRRAPAYALIREAWSAAGIAARGAVQGEPTRTKAAERACGESSRVSGQDIIDDAAR